MDIELGDATEVQCGANLMAVAERPFNIVASACGHGQETAYTSQDLRFGKKFTAMSSDQLTEPLRFVLPLADRVAPATTSSCSCGLAASLLTRDELRLEFSLQPSYVTLHDE